MRVEMPAIVPRAASDTVNTGDSLSRSASSSRSRPEWRSHFGLSCTSVPKRFSIQPLALADDPADGLSTQHRRRDRDPEPAGSVPRRGTKPCLAACPMALGKGGRREHPCERRDKSAEEQALALPACSYERRARPIVSATHPQRIPDGKIAWIRWSAPKFADLAFGFAGWLTVAVLRPRKH